MTVYATTKTISIEDNEQTVDNVKYTKRFKFGGKASISNIDKLDRVVSFDVEGPVEVYVVAASGGSDSRTLTFSSIASDAVDKKFVDFQALSFDKTPSSVTFVYTGGKATIYIYGKDKALNMYDIKISSVVTTAASSFSTYAASYPVDYKSLGLTAYAISLDEAAKKVTYTEIDGIVPANTAVLVKGEASKTYSLTKAEGDAAEVTTSLQVSDGKVVTEGGLYYAFSTVDGKSGFKRIADGITIPAKKGYLKLATANAKSFFSFDGEVTGIKGIENGTIDEEETPLYNLAGQRVNKDYKGVVVKNGKKFFNK